MAPAVNLILEAPGDESIDTCNLDHGFTQNEDDADVLIPPGVSAVLPAFQAISVDVFTALLIDGGSLIITNGGKLCVIGAGDLRVNPGGHPSIDRGTLTNGETS